MPWTLNTGTCLWQGDLFYSAGLYRNHVLATSNTGKIGRGFNWKNAGEWTGRVEIGKEEISGSKRSMYGYILTYSRLKGRTFKLCVLTRWDFNFCVRSSPLRGSLVLARCLCFPSPEIAKSVCKTSSSCCVGPLLHSPTV